MKLNFFNKGGGKQVPFTSGTIASTPAVDVTTNQPAGPVAAGAGKRNFAEGMVSTKDIIAPSALEVDTDFIKIGNKFYRTVFTVINRRFVEINWLSSLINFDASLAVSMYIYPSDGKEILDDLRRKITEMEAELTTDIQRGRIVNPATQAKLEDALNLQADLVKGEERFFQMGLYITISADTKEDLDRITKNLEAAMGALMVLTKKTSYLAEDGFITTLPLCMDKLNITRNMDTTSLATTFPFVSSDLSDDKGIMFGINEHNGSLVIFDRFSMPNYNSVVFATAGAGKSYMIKLEALRSLMLGTEIIVIDPENEYKDLCEASGGQYIAFGYGEASKINPFDLSLVNEEGENALNSKVLTLHKLLKIMLGEMDPIEESILDRAVVDAYKMKGITPDPESQTREAPLIEDLYKSLIGMEDQKAQGLAARLEKYIKGSFAGIFNQKTTVNLNNAFVVFGIRNLEDSLRPVAMHIVLDYIWTVVKKDMKRRILVVDEAWYLMQYADSAAFLRGIVKRGRKYYLGVTTITQDVDDFLQTPYGREIVTNSSIQILLKQHSAAIDQVGEVFYLSEGEKQLLLSADKGEGIFFAGQNHVAIRVVASEDEHKLITSNPEEIMKMKQQAKLLLQKNQESEKASMKPLVIPETMKTEVKVEKPIDQVSSSINNNQLPTANDQTIKNEETAPPVPSINLGPPPQDQGGIKTEEKVAGLEEVKPVPPAEPVKTDTVPEEKKPADNSAVLAGGSDEGKKLMFETVISEARPEAAAEPSTEEILKKRIADMEEEEKSKIEEHKKKVEEETKTKEEENKKMSGTLGNFGSLPKYQDLFVNKSKLPPLPPLPKFEPPKAEAVTSTNTGSGLNKPLFVNQVKEVNIPQPPQLSKKPAPVFEEKPTEQTLNPSVPPVGGPPPFDKGELKTGENVTGLEEIKPIPPTEPVKTDTVLEEKKPTDAAAADIKPETTTVTIGKAEDKTKMDYDKLFGNGIV
jgi:conjugal transfer ATP-binding protein TraC